MRSVVILASAAGLLAAAPVLAADALQFGPPEAWVKTLALPDAPAPTAAGAPIQVLLENAQINFADDGTTTYTELAFRITSPQGLQAAQTAVSWKPDSDTITVHKVHIIRGGQVIDVLADGQTFSTLRRESNLEQSMLDGVLTAVLQPEDVQVGDIIDYSVSIKRNDPVLHGRAEAFVTNIFPVSVVRAEFSAQWPKSRPIKWKASSDLKDAKLSQTTDGNRLSVGIDNLAPAKGPDEAPARFFKLTQIEYSQFASWGEVSSLMAPYYAKAETLKADSKLMAEADKIRATSSDPKVQAAAALHLVQNKIRYVFLGMDQGGYVPADADVTWGRRFGDCKGKTALLLALLHTLGIKAEPALVNTGPLGDGLGDRLPVLEAFDHVIVRAEIGGKVYWLDGTRYGDRDLDSLTVPDFRWALPVRAAGAGLETLKPAPLTVPQTETTLTFDATAGLDTPAPVHGEIVYRGDYAVQLNTQLAQRAAADVEKGMREFWTQQYSFITVDKASWAFDAAANETRFLMDGKAKMDWDTSGSSRSRQYEADGAGLGWESDLKRDPDQTDIPVQVSYPTYNLSREVIRLPGGGKGFTVRGDSVDQTLAGFAFKRTLAIKDGTFVMEASSRAVAPEIPYKEAVAAAEPMKALSKQRVFVKAPVDYQPTKQDAEAAASDAPKTAADYLTRAERRFNNNQVDEALADLDAAIKLEPENGGARAQRAYARFTKGDKAGAKADLDLAANLAPQDSRVYATRGAMALADKDYAGAQAAFTRALDLNPRDLYSLVGRAEAYDDMGDPANASRDAAAAVKADPESLYALRTQGQIFVRNKRFDDAIATVRAAIAVSPEDAGLHYWLGSLLKSCAGQGGHNCDAQSKEAFAEFSKVIEIQPTDEAYVARAWSRPYYLDRAGREADVAEAFKLDPRSAPALLARGQFYLNDKAYDKALADAQALLADHPGDPRGLFLRAQVYDATGAFDKEAADYEMLLAAQPDNIAWSGNLCLAYGTHGGSLGVKLEKGLQVCNALVARAPLPDSYEARGLVYLQMGRYDEAIADYKVVLTARPDLPAVLYPLGVAEFRKGLTEKGMADVAKANSLNSHIGARFAGYGITAPPGPPRRSSPTP